MLKTVLAFFSTDFRLASPKIAYTCDQYLRWYRCTFRSNPVNFNEYLFCEMKKKNFSSNIIR